MVAGGCTCGGGEGGFERLLEGWVWCRWRVPVRVGVLGADEQSQVYGHVHVFCAYGCTCWVHARVCVWVYVWASELRTHA